MTNFNFDKTILDLCGGSGSWSQPYADAGYDVQIVTLPSSDVIDFVPPPDVYGVLAAPPCDEFSIAKDHRIGRNIKHGMHTVNACIRIIWQSRPKFWALENPKGLLRKFLGKEKGSFQPWWYGDPWTKLTSLWGEFNFPEQIYKEWEDVPKIPELYIRPGRSKPSIAFLHKSAKAHIPWMHKYPCSSDAAFRAITPAGFAKAFFEANR